MCLSLRLFLRLPLRRLSPSLTRRQTGEEVGSYDWDGPGDVALIQPPTTAPDDRGETQHDSIGHGGIHGEGVVLGETGPVGVTLNFYLYR